MEASNKRSVTSIKNIVEIFMNSVLILGSKGMLGGALGKLYPQAVLWDREDVDVTNFDALREKIFALDLKPTAIINCVAFNDVDGAEQKKDAAFLLNTQVPGTLATISAELNIPVVHFSTNYVFDGKVGEYDETAEPRPLSVYASSKYQGEVEVQNNTQLFYIIRTAVLFGPKGQSEVSKRSFVDLMLDLSSKSDTIKAVTDEINSITYVNDLAHEIKNILDTTRPYGIYHVTNSGSASWYDLAKEIFAITKKNINLISVVSSEFPRAAARPAKSVLINTKFPALRPWQQALAEFLKDYEV